MTAISTIREHLEAEVFMLKRSGIQPRLGNYMSISDFVLRNGCQMMTAGTGCLPKGIKRGAMKMCYMNASRLAINPRYRGRFIYCEGYAAGVIPVMHAWCVDAETGMVVDPTWKDVTDYYGVKFRLQYVFKMMQRTGTYGVIDQWKVRWPVMTDDPKLWRHA